MKTYKTKALKSQHQNFDNFSKIYKIGDNSIKINEGRLYYHSPRNWIEDQSEGSTEITNNIEISTNNIDASLIIDQIEFSDIENNCGIYIKVETRHYFTRTLIDVGLSDGSDNPGPSSPYLSGLLCEKFYEIQPTCTYEKFETPPDDEYGEDDFLGFGYFYIKFADIITEDRKIKNIKQYHFGFFDVTMPVIYYDISPLMANVDP